VESQFDPKASSFGVLARAGTISFAPVDLRGHFRPAEPSTTFFELRWILAHCSGGSKRKVCERVLRSSHAMHNFSTSPGIVQVHTKMQNCAENFVVCAPQKL
jgi:hypothetical protein